MLTTPQYKHIIWDWNGTLLDDGWLFVELINHVLKKRGMKELSLLDYKNTFCFPLETEHFVVKFSQNVRLQRSGGGSFLECLSLIETPPG